MNILQLVYSTDLKTGGVARAVADLEIALTELGIKNQTDDNAHNHSKDKFDLIIVHGLWQWPGVKALKLKRSHGTPYIVFPHGMLDPWFKANNPFKHFKKQIYWLFKQYSIIKNSSAVCFTTEVERQLARKTFWPYRCKEKVTGLGVASPQGDKIKQTELFEKKFPDTKNKKQLLYMGRVHPKKGLDLLLSSFVKNSKQEDLLVIAAPLSKNCRYTQKLYEKYNKLGGNILWTGMLDGDIKWGALRTADALILPSHQENFGMVVAEACSVSTPVLITNKVNLYQEILHYDAGLVERDDQNGVDNLLSGWFSGKLESKKQNAYHCFKEKLHISRAAEKIIAIARENKQSEIV